jgi:hypothetical protein
MRHREVSMFTPSYSAGAAVVAGLALGAVSGFLVAEVAAALIGWAARLIAGPPRPRPRPIRLVLAVGIVATDLAVAWAAKEAFWFALGWALAAATAGAVHLVAVGLGLRRRTLRRARLAYSAAWVACVPLAVYLVGLASDGAVLPSFAILWALLTDVALQRRRADREPATRPLSTRRMMAAVAVAALPFGAAALWRRAGEYRELADLHLQQREMVVTASGVPPEEARRIIRARDAYHEAMFRKYDRVARYPFLPVAPDPPEPE